jgi:hypothetical protein
MNFFCAKRNNEIVLLTALNLCMQFINVWNWRQTVVNWRPHKSYYRHWVFVFSVLNFSSSNIGKHLMALLQKLASISKRASTIQYRIYDSLSLGDIYRVSRLINIFSKPSKHQVKRDDKFNDEASVGSGNV